MCPFIHILIVPTLSLDTLGCTTIDLQPRWPTRGPTASSESSSVADMLRRSFVADTLRLGGALQAG